jgi:ParB-like chromosome segregation protein Spo0J
MTLPWMAAKIVLRPVAELRPHAGNARVHSAEQQEQIKASMLAFGFTNALLVDEDGVLIAGHGRLEAATAIGMAKVPVIVLRHLSAAQREALRLADNRIAENATWDHALLRDALAAVQAVPDLDLVALGFSADELADILSAAGDAVSDGDAPEALSADPAERAGAAGAGEEPEEDPADADPEPSRQAVTCPGDLWLLGEHHLLCRDSTDAASVTRRTSIATSAPCLPR